MSSPSIARFFKPTGLAPPERRAAQEEMIESHVIENPKKTTTGVGAPPHPAFNSQVHRVKQLRRRRAAVIERANKKALEEQNELAQQTAPAKDAETAPEKGTLSTPPPFWNVSRKRFFLCRFGNAIVDLLRDISGGGGAPPPTGA